MAFWVLLQDELASTFNNELGVTRLLHMETGFPLWPLILAFSCLILDLFQMYQSIKKLVTFILSHLLEHYGVLTITMDFCKLGSLR